MGKEKNKPKPSSKPVKPRYGDKGRTMPKPRPKK